MNMKNLMMWGVIVLLVLGLFNLFQNPKNSVVSDKMPFSDFLKNIEDGRVVQVNIKGNDIEGILSDGTSFKTYAPNDPNLVEKLAAKGVTIIATPLEDKNIIESPLYYEPFIAYVPKHHRLSGKDSLDIHDLEDADLLLLEDGHCFRNQILNLCSINDLNKQFDLKSGNFQTLINLSNSGPWMTILPYLHSRLLADVNKKNLIKFNGPVPAREISIIYSKTQLKLPIINALKSTILKVIRGQIEYNDVKVMSPK